MTSTLEKVRSKIGAASLAALLAGNLGPRTAAAALLLGTGPMHLARDSHTATLLPNGKVLGAGGEHVDASGVSYLSGTELYDPITGTWTNSASSFSLGAGTSATLLPNGSVLFAGGVDDSVNELSGAELYDSANGIW